MRIRVGIKNSGLGMLNSKYLLAIPRGNVKLVIGGRSLGRVLDWRYKFGNDILGSK